MMIIATVIGPLFVGRTVPGMEDAAWVQVRTDEQILTAADPIGVRPGELVLLTTGTAAGRYRADWCTDLLIAAVLEESGNNG